MINSFDTDVAMDVGINAAIIYKNIQYWCEKNKANDQNYHDGYYWTYNSMKAFTEQFPYLSDKQIRSALCVLEEKGYIKSGNYNKAQYDRTKWYADVQKVVIQSDKREDCICPTGQMDLPQKANGFAPEGEPIPDIEPDIKPNDEHIYIEEKPKNHRFVPPTLEEVKAYCQERNNHVDPEKFIAYYSSSNWYRGKTKITDWKACVRTWERNSYSGNNKASKSSSNPFADLLKEEGYS